MGITTGFEPLYVLPMATGAVSIVVIGPNGPVAGATFRRVLLLLPPASFLLTRPLWTLSTSDAAALLIAEDNPLIAILRDFTMFKSIGALIWSTFITRN
jgi:hypothetical protein